MLYKFNGKKPVIGKGTYVSNMAEVIGDVEIGDGCYIGHGVIIRGDYGRIEIGYGTAVEEGVIIHAPPDSTGHISEKVTVGHGAIVHGKHIRSMAVIGMGSVISIRSEIGDWAIVAEGCVVKMNQIIPPEVVVAGNPAKVVRKILEKDKKFWMYGKQLYSDLAEKYLAQGMEPIN